MIQSYFEKLLKTSTAGDATEASYYPDLKSLMVDFLTEKGFDPSITVQPKRQAVGIPDFTVRKGKELIGYIEAKDPKYDNLEALPPRDTAQIKRYKEKLPNIILTNFFDFWLYRDGVLVKKVRIGFPHVVQKLKQVSPVQNEEQLKELLNMFFAYFIPETRSPKALAIELARRTQLLPDSIIEELENDVTTEIDRIYNAFKEYLISDLSPENFADIYAQTLTYGLFTARLNYKENDFNRHVAGDYIPKSIKILRDTFDLISKDAIPESLESYIDDIATVLAHSNIEKIKEQLRSTTGDSDPLIHFYETFLGEYDPKKRKSLGVYYTPLPVVSYIVRSVNKILKSAFGLNEGLASTEKVTLLDPASGTLTFPAEAIKEAIKEQKRFSEDTTSLKSHFLNHFYAFELQMAAYIIGHLRMGLLFEELNMTIEDGQRYPLYLTNSLDFSEVQQTELPFVAGLAQESKDAMEVKKKDILIILGNPPYAVEKKELGALPDWIIEKLQDYAKGLGVEKEKKKGVLQDDYVRFLRFAHWKIDQYGKGIVAMITNNSYLDGIVHRSMRKQLMDSFDQIYILNLHGNSRIKEKAPDGGEDKNVFDIQQGVSIGIFVKSGKNNKPKVFYKDVWGSRKEKYEYLSSNTVSEKVFKQIKPQPNKYYFIPKDYSLKANYDKYLSLIDIFSNHVSGVETKRDNFVIDYNKESLKNRVSTFANLDGDNKFIMDTFKLSSKSDLDIEKARKLLKEIDIREQIIPYSYRPFDDRWLFYDSSLVSRTRQPLMDVLLENNFALNVTRQLKANHKFRHALITDKPTDRILLSNTTSEASYVFPLCVKNEKSQGDLFAGGDEDDQNNISRAFWSWLKANREQLRDKLNSEEVFYYIYSILYSNKYRDKYLDFIKSGFPKIPFPNKLEVFKSLSELGKALANLHLLKDKNLNHTNTKLEGRGSNKVGKREWKGNKLYINNDKYFSPVTEEVWNYYIGGYQVCDKWLKDIQARDNSELTTSEIQKYCKLIKVIEETVKLQEKIDKLFPQVEET
jgi:predicted helicase